MPGKKPIVPCFGGYRRRRAERFRVAGRVRSRCRQVDRVGLLNDRVASRPSNGGGRRSGSVRCGLPIGSPSLERVGAGGDRHDEEGRPRREERCGGGEGHPAQPWPASGWRLVREPLVGPVVRSFGCAPGTPDPRRRLVTACVQPLLKCALALQAVGLPLALLCGELDGRLRLRGGGAGGTRRVRPPPGIVWIGEYHAQDPTGVLGSSVVRPSLAKPGWGGRSRRS